MEEGAQYEGFALDEFVVSVGEEVSFGVDLAEQGVEVDDGLVVCQPDVGLEVFAEGFLVFESPEVVSEAWRRRSSVLS